MYNKSPREEVKLNLLKTCSICYTCCILIWCNSPERFPLHFSKECPTPMIFSILDVHSFSDNFHFFICTLFFQGVRSPSYLRMSSYRSGGNSSSSSSALSTPSSSRTKKEDSPGKLVSSTSSIADKIAAFNTLKGRKTFLHT